MSWWVLPAIVAAWFVAGLLVGIVFGRAVRDR